MIGPDEALRLVVSEARPLAPCSVPLHAACGLTLAEPVVADRDHPPFDRAMMDGFAVRAADAGKPVRILGEVPAGRVAGLAVTSGSCLEILTGAPCPAGADAVVQKEHVRVEQGYVVLPSRILPRQHIAPRSSECPAGRTVLRPGATITPLAVAVLASFGRESVQVVPRPAVGIITTGEELAPPGGPLGPGQIRDSNGPMLAAMCCDMGLSDPMRLHAQDRPDAILQALAQCEDRPVVLLTGGVSVGTHDLVPAALKTYRAEIVFHRVRQKPGKPLLFARKSDQWIFGLPGNPLAAHLCFHRYAAAAIRAMSGKVAVLEPLEGRLAAPLPSKPARTFFVPARTERDADPDAPRWLVTPLPGLSSADVFAPCRANCYAEAPPAGEPIPAGGRVRFTWIGGAPWAN